MQISSKANEIAQLFQKERFATKREFTVISRITAESNRVLPTDFDSIVLENVFSKVK